MDHPRANCLFITFVEKEGPFLKVWGQTDKNTALYVQQMLFSATQQFDNGLCLLPADSLQVGLLCCAKYRDNKFYRARISNLSFLHNRYVEVVFIDYGHKDLVPTTNLRSLEAFNSSFIAVRPQATGLLLAEAVCPLGEWNDKIVDDISQEIRFTEATFTPVAQVAKQFLIRLYIGGNDFGVHLISRGIMRHTTLTTQEAVLLSTMAAHQAPPPSQSSQNIATYKAFTLEPGTLYPVYVSYITDGPCNFSVQLKQTEEALGKLMKEINSMNLTPLEDVPIPGTVCLARCAEDGHICRAVVTNEVDGNFRVFYVDFGNFEVVPLDSLYEISFKHVIPKAMAIRYALNGVEKSTVTLEMQCAFKDFVDNRLINMKVVPSSTRLALPKCELWDPATKVNALEVINRAATAAYPEHVALNRGFTQPVKVSYVRGCNKFYAQLKSKEDELSRLMGEIQQVCAGGGEPLNPQQVKVGLPCYALYEGDGQWYRGHVIEILPNGLLKIHYVDYGNEEALQGSFLKPIEGRHLTVLRPQAIECCFNGYQNMEPDTERDNLLEELILDGDFTMKVVDMQAGKALVELYDASNYNVASLLLDKIASKRSQISPMLLVQAGNKIEHRKPQQPERENKQWQNGTEDNTNSSSWRQDNRGAQPRKNEFETNNEVDNRNWRQNQNNRPNGGNNFDRNRREPDLNDSSGSEGRKNQNRNFNNRNQTRNVDNRNTGGAGDSWNQNKTDGGDWKQERGGSNRNNKDNTWGDSGAGDNQNSWGASNSSNAHNKEERKGFSPRGKDSGFKRQDRDGRRDDRNGWNADSSSTRQPGGFKKKTDFKKEGSEVSSSGSEKSFNKAQKSGGFNKTSPGGNKFGNKPRSFDNNRGANTEVPDAASSTDKFQVSQVVGTESNVTVSWFHNPLHFYVQLAQYQESFSTLMTDIQQAYKNRTPSSCEIGAPVIGLFPEDGVLYRAEILEKVGAQVKVRYVDFGNAATIDKVWPIEKRFMALPAQALRCGLAAIKSPGDAWPQGQSYGKYFDRGPLHCKFEANDGETNHVRLDSNGQDIGRLLVSDGLACELPPPRIVEIPLLFGQQFRVLILSVNGLNDFNVCLQDGTPLSCAAFMLSVSTETHEDLLKAKIGEIVIIYVDNVIDDSRLEVTVYDGSSGLQVKLVDGNPDAFESVELTCPYLITRSSISGCVSHYENGVAYLQPDDCVNSLELLLNAIFEFYDSSVLDTPIVPTESFLYAVKSSDGNWYRARVLTTLVDGKVQVNFIDYGNSEDVEVQCLRDLTSVFMEYNIMCIPVNVTIPGENLVGNAVTFNVTFSEAGVDGTLASELPQIIATTEEPPQSEPLQSGPVQSGSVPEGSLVVLSHVDSPGDFYLQLSETIPAIESLQALLQEQVASMPDLDNPKVAALCAAPYFADQQWYRATILDGDSDITTVRFVDYGNTDVLDNKTAKVKTLPADLLALEVHATRCRMKIKPIEDEWSAAASERFEVLKGVDNLTAKFLHQDEKTNYVELYSNGLNVAEILVNEGLAKVDEVAPSVVGSRGFVSHLNSPSEFWMQLENCVEELEWVAEQLSGAESFPELEDSSPGAMCAALFPDDQMWYRARILSDTIAGVEVLFVDYGNSCTSCSLRTLPEDLVSSPPLAQKCSLAKPDGLGQWSPSMVEKFSALSADGQTTFAIDKLSTGETALVRLQLDGQDVASSLLPITEPVNVKSFCSFEDLVLVKNGQAIEGVFKIEPMPDADWAEDSVSKFTDLTKNGETVFQAEFVSDNVVRLYIDLDDVRLDLSVPKKQSVTSTPVKMRSDSNEPGDHSDTLSVVEPIITDIVDNIGDDDLSQSQVSEFVTKEESVTPESPNTSGHSHVRAIVEDLIESSVTQGGSEEDSAKSELIVVETTAEELAVSESQAEEPPTSGEGFRPGSASSDNEEKIVAGPLSTSEFLNESFQTAESLNSSGDSQAQADDVFEEELSQNVCEDDRNAGVGTDKSEDSDAVVQAVVDHLVESVPTVEKSEFSSEGSRPQSACSGKIPHDEKLVAASVTNPEMLLKESTEESGDCDNK